MQNIILSVLVPTSVNRLKIASTAHSSIIDDAHIAVTRAVLKLVHQIKTADIINAKGFNALLKTLVIPNEKKLTSHWSRKQEHKEHYLKYSRC